MYMQALVRSSAGTGFLHESFHKDNATVFTRPWFAWVNGLFGELIIRLADERPHLILEDLEDEKSAKPSFEAKVSDVA